MKFSRGKKTVEVFGPPLIKIKGALYRMPEGAARGIWELPVAEGDKHVLD